MAIEIGFGKQGMFFVRKTNIQIINTLFELLIPEHIIRHEAIGFRHMAQRKGNAINSSPHEDLYLYIRK